MCEILVRVRDKTNSDPYLNVKLLKRGDAVVVCPDGWVWGPEELTNPDWRIIKLPNVTESQAAGFLAPEPAVDPQNPSLMLQRRAFKLDLAHASLPAPLLAWIADDSRAQPTRTINLTPAQFLALKIVKPVVPDPNVL